MFAFQFRPTPARHPVQRGAFTIIELLVVIAILGILFALLASAIQRARAAGQRVDCANRERQLGLALHGYHQAHGSFPPGMSYRDSAAPYQFMTWHTRILPCMGEEALWDQAVQAYQQYPDSIFLNSPPHPLGTVRPMYSCPADSRSLQVGRYREVSVALTDYLGVEGLDVFHQNGILFVDSQVRFADVLDGTSNTLLVGERPPPPDNAFGWWYAGTGQLGTGSLDSVLGVRELNLTGLGLRRYCSGGPYSFVAGQRSDQCDDFHFWSLHPGGANFLFADGSVHFLPYSANNILPALASRAGGETVEVP